MVRELSSNGVIYMDSNEIAAACCITGAGELYTWGNGYLGILGHGDDIDQRTPKRVDALAGVNVKQVVLADFHTTVCTEDGQVYTFGCGSHGRLGHGDKDEHKFSPVMVQALEGKKHITQVQQERYNTMALTSSGYVFTWGTSEYDHLWDDSKMLQCISIPYLVEGLREHNVIHLAKNSFEHCAVLVDHTSPSIIRQ
jgi:alpha-tubulin suppressor-like RCC1 family protein